MEEYVLEDLGVDYKDEGLLRLAEATNPTHHLRLDIAGEFVRAKETQNADLYWQVQPVGRRARWWWTRGGSSTVSSRYCSRR